MPLKGKLLYLGLDPANYCSEKQIVHYPIIQTEAFPFHTNACRQAIGEIARYSHIILTSKTTVRVFQDCLRFHGISAKALKNKTIIAIGKSTAECLMQNFALKASYLPKVQTAEGIIQVLKMLDLTKAYIFFPKSYLARPVIEHYLIGMNIRHQTLSLYNTKPRIPQKARDLRDIDEIVFTSPSSVKAFLHIYRVFPKNVKLSAIGPITGRALAQAQRSLPMES